MIVLVDHRQQFVQRCFCVAVEHAGVFLEEQRVLDARVARALAALRHEDLLRLPHFQHRDVLFEQVEELVV